jgi:hypothetical protein
MKQVSNTLTLLGTSLLASVDAFWRMVDFVTPGSLWRKPATDAHSRVALNNAR